MSSPYDKTVVAQKRSKRMSTTAKTHSSGTSVHENGHRSQSDSRHDLNASPTPGDQNSHALQDLPINEQAPLQQSSHVSDNYTHPQDYASDIHWDEPNPALFNPSFGSLSMPPAIDYQEGLVGHTGIQEHAYPHIWSGSSIPRCNQPSRTNPGDVIQLQQWAYETSNSNLTIAERFEKRNWEKERRENL